MIGSPIVLPPIQLFLRRTPAHIPPRKTLDHDLIEDCPNFLQSEVQISRVACTERDARHGQQSLAIESFAAFLAQMLAVGAIMIPGHE